MSDAVLRNVVVVSPTFHIWSGRKKLRPEDLLAEGATLPPEQIVSLGSKKICDPAILAPFRALKRRAESICLEKGVRFVKGYAVPRLELDGVLQRLNQVCQEFDAAKAKFLAVYDEERSRWIGQFPGFAHILQRDVLPRQAVARRLAAWYNVFQVNPAESEVAALATSAAADLTTSLADQLFLEVASDAGEFMRRSLDGRIEVTRKALRPLRAMRAKLDALSFVDGRVGPIVAELDKVLAAMPPHKITGTHLTLLRGACALLINPATMLRHGEAIVKGGDLVDAMEAEQADDVDDADDATHDSGVAQVVSPQAVRRDDVRKWDMVL